MVQAILILLTMTISFTTQASYAPFMREASGVCRIGETVVVVGDEDPDSMWLSEGSGVPKKIKVKSGNWDDAEDLTAVDDRYFFAITSHSRTKNSNKRKAEREQLLLISHNGGQLKKEKSWSLRGAVLEALDEYVGQDVDLDEVEGGGPNDGGLNIEGLVLHDGKLFIGLRSPLTEQGETLVLVVDNVGAMLKGGKPQIARALRLDLGKRGIRGLATDNHGLVVLSGPIDDNDKKTFALHHLNMKSSRLDVFNLPGFKNLLRPEGVTALSDGSYLFVQDFEEPQKQGVVVILKP